MEWKPEREYIQLVYSWKGQFSMMFSEVITIQSSSKLVNSGSLMQGEEMIWLGRYYSILIVSVKDVTSVARPPVLRRMIWSQA